MRWIVGLFISVVIATFLPGSASAQRRVALLIGNGAYTKVPDLANPPRDSAALEKLLGASGFDVVRRADNLGLVDMRRALRAFSTEVSSADVAVIFFAGHGIEVNGNNYLIPIDAALERDIDVEDEAVPLDRVNQILEPAKRLRLIILDACRDNPFVRSMKRSAAGRSIGRGLAKVEVLTSDTLIAYAARAGSTASDGSGTNSPYTDALIKHLTTPGLDVRLALGRVRDEVLKTTGNRQEPFVYGSLGGAEIALVGARALDAEKPTEVATSQRPSEAAEAWDRAKDATSIAILDAYVARFPGTFYADLARARIEELRKAQTAVLAPSKVQPDAATVVVPANTFFKGQTPSQRITTQGDLIGALVRASDGKQLGVVQAVIVEGSATVGLLFNYNGKMVALRTTSPNVAVDGRSVALRVDNAPAILAALDSYQLATAGRCAGKDQAACGMIEACNWIPETLDTKTGTVKTRGYCRSRPQ
jgi:Caspase domain